MSKSLSYKISLGKLSRRGPSIGSDLSVKVTFIKNVHSVKIDRIGHIKKGSPIQVSAQIMVREKDTKPEYDDIGYSTTHIVIPDKPGLYKHKASIRVATRGGDRVKGTTFVQEFIINVFADGDFSDGSDADYDGVSDDPEVRAPSVGKKKTPPVPVPKKKEPETKPPLLFVPGIMACELVNSRGEQVWPPRQVDDRFKEGDNERALLAKFHKELEKIATGASKQGFKTNGKFVSVEGYHPYQNLLRELKKVGYVPGDNLLVFYYDWTLSNEINGKKLTVAVKDFLKKFPEHDKIKAICHSMGGLVTRSAITLEKAPIDPSQTVYIGTPHLGAPQSYFTVHPDIKRNDLYEAPEGQLLSVETMLFLNSVLNFVNIIKPWRLGEREFLSINKAFAKISFYTQSSFELMPDEYYLSKRRVVYIVDPNTPARKRRYGKAVAGGVERVYFEGEWRLPHKYRPKVKKAMDFKRRLGKIPGSPLCIFGSRLKTPYNVKYWESEDDMDEGMVPSSWPEGFVLPSRWRSGDGTVPAFSAKGGYQRGLKLLSIGPSLRELEKRERDIKAGREAKPETGEHMRLADEPKAIAATIKFLKLKKKSSSRK